MQMQMQMQMQLQMQIQIQMEIQTQMQMQIQIPSTSHPFLSSMDISHTSASEENIISVLKSHSFFYFK